MKKLFKAIWQIIKKLFCKRTLFPKECTIQYALTKREESLQKKRPVRMRLEEPTDVEIKLTQGRRHYVYYDTRIGRTIRKPLGD